MAEHDHIQWLFDGRVEWHRRRSENAFTPDFSGVDLYKVFLDKNKLDPNGDIPLNGFDLRRANFAETRLHSPFTTDSVDLRNADLRSANFRAAHLPNAKLDNAELIGASLADANLAGACLRRSVLTSAGLPGTNLFGADLTNADLGSAYLEGANLCFAKLDGADLTTAVLTGADVSCSRPWKAKLFPPPEFDSGRSDTSATRRIDSIADLLEHCAELRTNAPPDRVFYFRGERNKGWDLEPSVMREKDGIRPLRAHEGEMLLELMSKRPEDFTGAPTGLAQWVLAQHHGLKTRLVDITRNPLVALLGACGGLGAQTEESDSDGQVHVFSVPRQLIKPFTSDTVAVIANIAKLSRPEQDCLLGWTSEEIEQRTPDATFGYLHDHVMPRLYHLIRQERPQFMERIEPRDYFRVFVVEPLQSFERIRAQSGAFLLSAFHERFERDQVLTWNAEIPLYDHVILDVPNGSKEEIVRELALLSVTRESLLPGLDETANAITRRYSSIHRPKSSGGGADTLGGSE